MLNLLVFSEDGSPAFDQTTQMQGLIERFIHIAAEMNHRKTPLLVNFLEDASGYLCRYPNIRRAIKAWNNCKPVMGKYLVKFGKRTYLSQMRDAGKIQIKPASYYDDPSLNQAIQDQELLRTSVLPQGTKLKMQMNSGNYEEIEGILNISLTHSSPTDFYVYCLTKLYQHRLFDDFKADAALVIYDLNKFFRRLLDYLKKHYSDWLLASGDMHYYDPFFPSFPISIPFNKHFRFWYQCEFRIVFKLKSPVEKLEPINIEIGSLDDCCELVLLN